MRRNNIKVLDVKRLKDFDNLYEFKLMRDISDSTVIFIKRGNRGNARVIDVMQDISLKFADNIEAMKITKKANQMFIKNQTYSPIVYQNTINLLDSTLQPSDYEDVIKILGGKKND